MKIWAAIYGEEGTPVLAVYGTRKAEVEMLVADRKANGEAFDGERVVWFANAATYAARLMACKLPRSPSCLNSGARLGNLG